MRALLDTNIVFDILCDRPYDQEALTELKVMLAFGDVELWVSAKSYTDLFYCMRSLMDSDKAQQLLESTLQWAHVCSVEQQDIRHALGERWTDMEDCLINVCAEKVKADYLITRDKDGFAQARIPHGSAADFMAYVYEKTQVRYAIQDV